MNSRFLVFFFFSLSLLALTSFPLISATTTKQPSHYRFDSPPADEAQIRAARQIRARLGDRDDGALRPKPRSSGGSFANTGGTKMEKKVDAASKGKKSNKDQKSPLNKKGKDAKPKGYTKRDGRRRLSRHS